MREETPGIIGVPETWPREQLDTKLTSLFMRHGPNYFKGRFRSLAAIEAQEQAV
jgi:hypothetical protein